LPDAVPAATFTEPSAVFNVTPALVVETCVRLTSANKTGLIPLRESLDNTFASDCPPTTPSTFEPVSLTASMVTTVNVELAVLPVPPFVEETAPLVLFFAPFVVAVTSTATVQVPLATIVPPLKVRLVSVAAGVKVGLPQPEILSLGIEATSRSLGSESVKATPVRDVPEFEFVIVKVSVLTSPTEIILGEKALLIEGLLKIVTVFDAQLLFVSSISATIVPGSTLQTPALLGLTKEPAAVGVTVIGTLNDPPDGIVTLPLAVQVKVLVAIAQLIIPVVPPAFVTLPTAYVAPVVGSSSVKST